MFDGNKYVLYIYMCVCVRVNPDFDIFDNNCI